MIRFLMNEFHLMLCLKRSELLTTFVGDVNELLTKLDPLYLLRKGWSVI
jgi:hypothetical protein